MPISDDTILMLAKEVGESNALNRQAIDLLKTHMADQQAHSGVIPRMESLEKSRGRLRRFAFTALAGSTVGGAAEAKTSVFSKFISLIGS